MVAAHPEGEWVPIARVLARVNGSDSPSLFDAQARALAKTMRDVWFNWADEPCIVGSRARELRESLEAEAAARRRAVEERLVAEGQARAAAVPRGVPLDAVPVGVSAAEWMMLNDPERQQARRESMVEHSLRGGGIVIHPLPGDGS